MCVCVCVCVCACVRVCVSLGAISSDSEDTAEQCSVRGDADTPHTHRSVPSQRSSHQSHQPLRTSAALCRLWAAASQTVLLLPSATLWQQLQHSLARTEPRRPAISRILHYVIIQIVLINKIHLVGVRFILKIHQNTGSCDVSVSVTEFWVRCSYIVGLLFLCVLQCLLSIFVTHLHGIMSVANNSYTSFMYVLQVKLFAGDVEFYICRNCQYNWHQRSRQCAWSPVYVWADDWQLLELITLCYVYWWVWYCWPVLFRSRSTRLIVVH